MLDLRTETKRDLFVEDEQQTLQQEHEQKMTKKVKKMTKTKTMLIEATTTMKEMIRNLPQSKKEKMVKMMKMEKMEMRVLACRPRCASEESQ